MIKLVRIGIRSNLCSLQKQKKPVVYLSFPDEGHGIAKFANSLCHLAYCEEHLAKFFGGRFEPISEEISKKSSARIQISGEPVESKKE